MKPKELIKILQADGWYIERVQGSHHILKHPVKQGMSVVPLHNKDLKPGTLNSILKQAGLK
ncbi:type II toxin-antitoxin system HicA family toxin [Pectinatus frisingensis]|uniref:type II toxin-antitoxin system HicA family toxin n=1 Tax=Pectinatus frisingensis TaxID=865 RepID=UPI0018C51C58|nr:type II toxin-antitoxin system HicA family toxin [Pectinatus frisingensis]